MTKIIQNEIDLGDFEPKGFTLNKGEGASPYSIKYIIGMSDKQTLQIITLKEKV